jgi:hypothetical protein
MEFQPITADYWGEVTLRLTVGRSVGQSVWLGIEHPGGTCDQILLPVGMLLSEIWGLASVGRPLWRENEHCFHEEVTLRLTVGQSVCLGIEHPCGTCNQILLPIRMLLSYIFVVPSLTRGRVCYLQCNRSMVWVDQNPKPYFTVSSETPTTWKLRFPYLYPPGTGWPSYNPGHWVLFRISIPVSLYSLSLSTSQENADYSKSKPKLLNDSVSQSVCLGIEYPCGT